MVFYGINLLPLQMSSNRNKIDMIKVELSTYPVPQLDTANIGFYFGSTKLFNRKVQTK